MKKNNFLKFVPVVTVAVIAVGIMTLFTFCDENAFTEPKEIRMSGAFALSPLASTWAEAYNDSLPEEKMILFNIQAGGAGKGLMDVLNETVDLGMFSRKITQAEINQGIWWTTVCIDVVLPTVNAGNPVLNTLKKQGLKKSQFKNIFIDDQKTTWGALTGTADGTHVNAFTRSDASGAADTWAAYLGAKQEQLKGIGVFGDPGIADAVSRDPYGIGYNNAGYAYDTGTGKLRDGIEVIPIDLNENGKIDADEDFYGDLSSVLQAIADGKYPFPPARELYFISKGKPKDKATLDFLKWVLTTGQSFVASSGYVPLKQAQIDAQLKKLR